MNVRQDIDHRALRIAIMAVYEYISVDGHERQAAVYNIFAFQDSGWRILLDHTSCVGQKR